MAQETNHQKEKEKENTWGGGLGPGIIMQGQDGSLQLHGVGEVKTWPREHFRELLGGEDRDIIMQDAGMNNEDGYIAVEMTK